MSPRWFYYTGDKEVAAHKGKLGRKLGIRTEQQEAYCGSGHRGFVDKVLSLRHKTRMAAFMQSSLKKFLVS